MRVSLRLCSAVQPRKPSIHFLGRRTPSRSSSLPIRSISNRSQPPLTSQCTSQTDSDASPTLPTHDIPLRSSQHRLPQRSPNALERQPLGYYDVSRLQRASAPRPLPTMLANILASSMHPPPEPPLPPQFKPLSPLRPWERVWSGPQWYTPRPPIHPPRKRSKTVTASSLPKSRLPSNDDPDPDQLPVQVVLTPQQRKVLALQQEARRRVDRIVNFGRRLHSTGNE
jgi:hypothetical protein